MSYLSKESIMEVVKRISKGTVFRIGYRTEVPVKAEFKKMGIWVEKLTEETVRTGVAYKNITAVKEQQKETSPTRKINREWIIKNTVSHIENTGKDYLHIARFNQGGHKRCVYVVHTSEGTTVIKGNEFRENLCSQYIINSYFNNSFPCEIKTVNLENIYKIGELCEEQDVFSLV